MGNAESSQAPIEWALVPSSRTISRDETLGDIAVVAKLLAGFGGRINSNSISQTGDGDDSDDGEPVNLDFLKKEPEFRRLRELVQNEPDSLVPILNEVREQNPGLVVFLLSHQDEFLTLLNERDEDDDDDDDDDDYDDTDDDYADDEVNDKSLDMYLGNLLSSRPSEEDVSAIKTLNGLGFDQERATEAYLACDRNVHRAAELLLDQQASIETTNNEIEDASIHPPSRSNKIPSQSTVRRRRRESPPKRVQYQNGDLIDLSEGPTAEDSDKVTGMRLASDVRSQRSETSAGMVSARQAKDTTEPFIGRSKQGRANICSSIQGGPLITLANPITPDERVNFEAESHRRAPPVPKKPVSLSARPLLGGNSGVTAAMFDAGKGQRSNTTKLEYRGSKTMRRVSFDSGIPLRSTENSPVRVQPPTPPPSDCMCWLKPCPPHLRELSPSIIELRQKIKALQSENKTLRFLVKDSHTPKSLTLYRVFSSAGTKYYSDTPIFSNGALHGRKEMLDYKHYLRSHNEVVVLAFKDYDSDQYCSALASASLNGEGRSSLTAQSPSPISESFCVLASELSSALLVLTRDRDEDFPDFSPTNEIRAPYLFYYHNRRLFRDANSILPWNEQEQMKVFTSFLDESTVELYDKFEQLFAEGLCPTQAFCYLFTSDEILVSKEDGHYIAYKELGPPELEPLDSTVLVRLDVGRYAFDGSFEFQRKQITVTWCSDALDAPNKPITSLNIYPIRYAEEGVQDALRERGMKLWSCRHRRYVSYSHQDRLGEHVNARFMVDFPTYRKMHPFKAGSAALRDDLGAAKMASDDPPPGDFVLLLPAHVTGFDMNEKKWVQLQLDNISPVVWNKQAFEDLVIDPSTKELIQAVVTNQIAAEKSTDLIEKKGAGLIVLLHGGPGVGKTLTAESVAEISEKPLYRVTCGDIGTSPDTIEEYLETVLYLGRLWGCVVLLDEADIFLEQRSLTNLERNAIVSVFLRILEYYQGIFILTSNRVGVFDEAFKSRIHLTINYEALTEAQRKQIWRTFVKRLEQLEDDAVDIADVEYKIDELAACKMNGRQIRNAITTARQLALYKKQKMGFAHLEHVIKVAAKFERYVEQVHEEINDDQWAREQGVR